MKQRKKIVYYSIIAIVVAVTVGLVIGVFSVVSSNIIEKTTLDNISEIANHDKNTISMFVEYNWKNLQRAGERLKRNAKELNTVRGINEYLSYEAYESTFDKIYLLMDSDEGSYYTDITFRQNSTVTDFYDYRKLFNNGNYKVIGFDSLPVMNNEKVVIYGYSLDDKRVEDGALAGIVIGPENNRLAVKAIIGVTKRSSITDGLIVESFVDENGEIRGYSSVINLAGEYVVDRQDAASYGAINWFESIEKSRSSGLTGEQVKELMKQRAPFSFYLDVNGNRELNYCAPLSEYIDWYFVMSVNDDALAEQTNSYVWMIVVALGVTVAVIIAAMVVMVVMQNKTDKALAQEKAQSEFLSNMSHEIRTPLNGLVGLNYLMITAIDNPAKKKQVKEWLSKSHSTSKYLLSLINDILDVSKLRAGKVEVAHEPLIVESIVESVYTMQFDNIKTRGIKYSTDINITAPCILSDEVHLKQVLMNIVGNAAKFTPAGGRIKLSVNQTMTDETHVVTTFICEDTGCGMSKEFLNKIFDEFTQDRSSNKSSTKGTGLGMAISKMLINAMGGDITVQSELGKGSKFIVSVPAEISDIPDYMKLNANEEAERIADGHAEEFKSLKILVAEDNELNAEILMEILNAAGFQSVHVENGEYAVKAFEASEVGEFGVILMDMRMPVMDGCEASSKIRQLDRADAKTIPIFACTANTFKEDRVKAFDSGMNDFLTKPIDIKELLGKMEHLSKERK